MLHLRLQSSRAARQAIRDTTLNWLSGLLVSLGAFSSMAQGDEKRVYCRHGRLGFDHRVQSSACSCSSVSSRKCLCCRCAAAGRGVWVLERVDQGRVRLRKGMCMCMCVCVCTGGGMASASISKFEVNSRWCSQGKLLRLSPSLVGRGEILRNIYRVHLPSPERNPGYYYVSIRFRPEFWYSSMGAGMSRSRFRSYPEAYQSSRPISRISRE